MLIVRSTKGRPNKFDLVQICYINDFAVGSLARLLAQLPQPPVRGYDLRRRDRWHGAVEWQVHEIELALEPEHLTGQLARLCRTRRCVAVLARNVPHQRHQLLHVGGGKRGMNEEHMR